jgi:hypothetical protein
MVVRNRLITGGTAIGATVAALCIGVPMASAATTSAKLYVSPSGGGSGASCAEAGYSSIQAAADAAPAGGTVIVCKGTYKESVTITKSMTLAGRSGAVIDAKGMPYGVGMTASYVTVTGLTVKNATASDSAPGDGIITAGFGPTGPVAGDHETIRGNRTVGNQGSGIDVESSSYTRVYDNVSKHNGVGINVVDDFGKPASHNRIIGNVANRNPGGCGIVLAEHSGAGVFKNVVRGNVANRNGLGTPSAPNASSGSGIIIAGGGGKGGVYRNVVEYNAFRLNGHGGIAIHVHSKGMNFSGNRLVGNMIGTNNLRTDAGDLKHTGIYIGSASKLRVVVLRNVIMHNYYGIFTAGPVRLPGASTTVYSDVAHHRGSIKVFPATE